MKSWEKVMFYLLFPFAMFWHGVKKSAEYMERKSKPAIAMLVAVTMILSIMPMQSFAADTTTVYKTSIQMGLSSVVDGSITYFGKQSDNNSVKWIVLDAEQGNLGNQTGGFANRDAMFLLTYDIHDRNQFNGSDYASSVSKTMAEAFLGGCLSQAELPAVFATTKSDATVTLNGMSWKAETLSNAYIFPLSAQEFYDYYDVISNYGTDTYWLRSVNSSNRPGIAGNSANIGEAHDYAYLYNRYAMNFKKSTVLFSSNASGAAQTDFSSVPDYSGNEWKLTLKDSNDFSVGASVSATETSAGGELEISHKALSSFTNAEYTNITAMLQNADGEILYYGSVNTDINAAKTTITIPTDIALGEYTLSVYAEDWNGAYATDYATATPFETTVSVKHLHPVCGAVHTDIGNHTGECQNVTYTAWNSADSLPTEAGNYYLTGNVNLGSVMWDVPSGETKICLNGKELKAKKITIASGNTLTISDCGETGTVKRNGGFGQSGTIVENAGTFNLYGGSITGNTNWYGYGGGVINNGIFNMYGGAVTRNSADRWGGGVDNKSGATFNLYGGSITKNSGGTGGGLYNLGKFNMYGGEITGNKTDMDSYGGIYSANGINISGKVVINGNTNKNGDPSNYCSSSNGAVMIVGALETGSSIGVTRYQNIGTITTGGDEYIDYFFSDNAQYFVEKDGENLKLSEKEFTVDVTVNDNAYGTASANKTSGTKGTRVLLTAEPAKGYRLKEWKLISGGGSLYQSGSFYIGTENAKIQAVFEQAPTYTVQFNAGGGTGSKDSVTVFEGDSYILPANPFTAPTGKQFKAWSVGDKEYAVGDTITVSADTTVTAVWENILTEAPTAKTDLVYNGSEQELISAGSAISGTIQYALGTAEAVTGEWGTDIPKATKAGIYYVWYKVVGSDNYNDVEPACITVKIEKAMLTVVQSLTEIDWYPGMSIDYDASALKNLFTVTDANGKNFTFKINAVYNSSNQPIEEIVDAGVYTIELQPFYNSLVGNYSFGTKPLTLTVKPLDLTGQSVTRDTSLDPTYTGETALPLATSSGKLNFDIGKVYDILTKKERSRTLWANDGYWKFEVIEGKNSTDAGDAYISIVGLGGNVIGSCEFKYTIKQQKMAAPEGLVAVDETISKKKDGKISGLTTAMEYNTSKYGTYDPVTDVDMLFEADTYYVRTAAPNSNYKPSDPVEIIIGEGRKLTVTIPTAEEQIGYTLTVNTNEINWHGRVAITFELADGYSKSGTDFAVKVNGTAVTLDDYGKYILTDAETDVEITVEGVVDETAPEAEISITTNKWTSFLKDITFGLFFKETQDITITAIDKGSGEDKIYYYISEDALTEDEVKALTADKWTLYDADNKPSIDPDKKCVVYAKATDNAGNVKYISSDGLVFDGTAPELVGIENNGVYYGDKIFKALDDNFLKIEVDGIDITDTTQGDDEYKIVADNAEHTVTVTDKAGNITEWKITVYKQYTITFVVDGKTLTTQTVNHKADAEIPDIPKKEGYDQTAPTWDKDGKNITADTEFNAVYTINKYTVTYKADGEVVDAVTVEHGKNATLPAVPAKDGYVGKWDNNGKNITEDTTISAVYTAIPAVKPDEVKPDDKTELEDIKKQLEDMLDDDDYTEDDKKDIQEAIDGIDDALKVIENVEAVEELIDNLPEKITKNDEDAIKAANDAYNALTDYEKSLVDADAKKALDDAKAALAELNKPADTNSPQTGDNSNMALWFALLFISGGALITLTVVDRKRRTANK